MNDIVNLLYTINKEGFIIWLEANEINYVQYKNCNNKHEILNLIKEKKAKFIELLNFNDLTYDQNFYNLVSASQYIYRNDSRSPVLSFGQERIRFIEKYTAGTNSNNISLFYKLNNTINLSILEQSIKSIVDRHEILRTLIKEDDKGNGYQLVLDRQKDKDLIISYTASSSKEEFEEKLVSETEHTFNLSRDYPIKVNVHHVEAEKYLSIVIHHIAFDGWSIDIFLHELIEYYRHYSKNHIITLKDLSIQYKDFAIWQKHYLCGDRLAQQLSYWKNKLRDYEVLSLTTDKPRPNQINYKGKFIDFELTKELSEKSKNVSKQLGVSLYSFLLSVYYLMLRIYSNQNDIVVGSPTANRHYTQLENLIGLFINSLALRIKINPNMSIIDFIKLVSQETITAQMYQDLPFEKLVNELKIKKDTSRHPIFQVLFNFGEFGNNNILDLTNISGFLEPYKPSIQINNTAQFDLSIFIDDSQDVLRGSFNYATSLFDEITILKFIQTYVHILKYITNSFDDQVSKQLLIKHLQYIDSDEYEKIGEGWNETGREYKGGKTIHKLFEEQVAKTPDSIALIYGDLQLTYGVLNEGANKLAHYISNQHKIKPDTLIALCLERSEQMLISILAILKAGAAYVPIDPSYPDERIKYIINDAKIKVLLTDDKNRARLTQIAEASNTCVIAIDAIQAELLAESSSDLDTTTKDKHLAYVIYTSGTTGNPKGVMVEHQAYIATINAMVSAYFSALERIKTFSVTNYVFDIFGLEYGAPLLTGGCVHFSNSDFNSLNCKDYDFIQMTPSLCRIKLDNLVNVAATNLLIGGEKLTKELLQQLLLKNANIFNVYGPTETTIWSTANYLQHNNNASDIGLPLDNEKAYVLDQYLNPLPIGAVGELYLAGLGLARGYLDKPDLTAEKFIANPFNAGSRLYKTGDLVKQVPNGHIEYIGRYDSQIKFNGYRIELNEIESALASYPQVKHAVVLLKELSDTNQQAQQDKYPIAYYVADKPLEHSLIFAHLANKLPQYMIPRSLLHLTALPLNHNGKLDTNSLPLPETDDSTSFVAPCNPLELKLATIWSHILNIPISSISIFHDFFALGGNSILAIKLVAALNREFKTNIQIKLLFSNSTINSLSKVIQNNYEIFKYQNYLIQIGDTENIFKPFPLTNVQQAYYLGRFNSLALGNTSTHIYIEYKFLKLDINKLEKAWNYLINRHPVLKTIFQNDRQQFLKDTKPYTIEVNEISNEEQLLANRNRLSHKIYDPSRYPLFDIEVSKLDTFNILHISFDALIIDDNSFAILISEWTALYNNLDFKLPKLNISYRDYVLQYQKIKQNTAYEDAKIYWQNKLDKYNLTINLPLANNPISITEPKFQRITSVISKKIWDKLILKTRHIGISPTALVLEVYGKVISYWSNQNQVCINLTLFNRLPIHEQINSIVGDFTLLELFNYVDRTSCTIDTRIKLVHDELWSDIEHNLFDGIDLQRTLKQINAIDSNQVLAPIVLTSTIGQQDYNTHLLDQTYQGVCYSITQTSQIWLDNKAYETEEGLIAEWDYVEQLFDAETIQQMHNMYCLLLNQLAELDWQLEKMPILMPPEQSREIIKSCNCYKQEVSNDTLFDRYENFILKHNLQQNVAVIDIGNAKEYTYEQLMFHSNLLAKYLHFVSKHDDTLKSRLIGILSEKGYNHVVATTAIMKSGHGYLPLNIEWPILRLDEVLSQGQVKILLISRKQHALYEIRKHLCSRYKLVIIEDILFQVQNDRSISAKIQKVDLPLVKSRDIAYVIFTSGSTGKPKGVAINHLGALNTINAVNNKFKIGFQDKILALSELSFDLSVYDIFGILVVGGQIIFPDQVEAKNPVHWIKLINKYQITIWNTVPQLADLMIDSLDTKVTETLRLFLLSGDKISTSLVLKIKKNYPNALVICLGGATEASIWSIWYKIDSIPQYFHVVPYGTAMPNQNIYILNYNYEHCPINVAGEIYIGGLGVAIGYWQDNSKTSESFIQNNKLGRLYKTGDIGRWNKLGYVEFIGRKDNQVKLNGYRIELEEIDSKLTQLDGIDQSITQLKQEGNQYYIVTYLLIKDYNKYHKKIEYHDTEFKIAQKGIIKDLKEKHKINFLINKQEYFVRKSYRNFLTQQLDSSSIPDLYNKIISQFYASNKINQKFEMFTQETLIAILSKISGTMLEHNALPKYLYPSGGSSYSVRCFVYLPKNHGKISSGYYYYNPITHTLCEADNMFTETITQQQNEYPELQFVVYWPAIRPLYNELSENLVYKEVGHIFGLLLDIFDMYDLGYKLEVLDHKLDNENTLITKITLGQDSREIPLFDLRLNLLHNQQDYYEDQNHNRFLENYLKNILSTTTDIGYLLYSGKVLITLEGSPSIENLFFSGAIFQKMSKLLYHDNIGSCMLGINAYPSAIYAMILGKIDDDEKYIKSESRTRIFDVKEAINNKLAKTLPQYMLPYEYKILDRFPISTNGKIALDKLPPLTLKKQHIHESPNNSFEAKLCKIWSEILALPEQEVGINDSFFRLGGNSLLAMQTVKLINKELQINFTIRDLYNFNNITEIAKKFNNTPLTNRQKRVI